MRKFYKIFYLQIIPIFILGFSIGVISIWPGIISESSRKCFFNILKDGSDGSIKIGTVLSINPNYLLKIKRTKNKYLRILLVGDSCFRKFWTKSSVKKGIKIKIFQLTLSFLKMKTVHGNMPRCKDHKELLIWKLRNKWNANDLHLSDYFLHSQITKDFGSM